MDLKSHQLQQPAAFKRCHFLPRRFEDDFELDNEVLGTGYGGDVLLGRSRFTGARVAVKSFSAEGAADQRVDAALDEAQIYLALDHPHIVRLHDVYVAEAEVQLVMECMDGGEFFDRIRSDAPFSEQSAGMFLRQILLALAYLHRQNIAHCDVKLENFLLEQKGGDVVKLCDFGFSQLCPPNSALYKPYGTTRYMSPNVFQGCYTETSDLWSLGVAAYIMLTNRMPFTGEESDVREAVLAGSWDDGQKLWGRHSPAALDFVRGLLHRDSRERLSAEAALAHPWLRAQAPEAVLDASVLGALRSFSAASPLQRASFTALAWAPGSAEAAALRQTFLALNSSNTGVLSRQELETALQAHYGLPAAQVDALFATLDLSGEGVITYSDFLACMVASDRVTLRREQAQEVFAAFDQEGCGSLTRRSFERLVESAPSHVMSQCLKEMTVETSISQAEFLSLLSKEHRPSPAEEQLQAQGQLPTLLQRRGQEERTGKGGLTAKPRAAFDMAPEAHKADMLGAFARPTLVVGAL